MYDAPAIVHHNSTASKIAERSQRSAATATAAAAARVPEWSRGEPMIPLFYSMQVCASRCTNARTPGLGLHIMVSPTEVSNGSGDLANYLPVYPPVCSSAICIDRTGLVYSTQHRDTRQRHKTPTGPSRKAYIHTCSRQTAISHKPNIPCQGRCSRVVGFPHPAILRLAMMTMTTTTAGSCYPGQRQCHPCS